MEGYVVHRDFDDLLVIKKLIFRSDAPPLIRTGLGVYRYVNF